MAVMAREAWTDERLDDLNKRADDGFNGMREEFRAVRGEMRGEFRAVRQEMQALHRTAMVVMIGGFGTMLVGFGGTIATILLTQG
jgi:hypothetical protein